MFEAVKTLLTEKRLLLKAGTIVDATIIAAPSSTKNATQARDPEMKQTRKGQQWYVGMKIHVGTDTRGVVHSLTTTDAAVADISQLPHLVRGSETTLFGDKAYCKTEHQLHWEASGGHYRVNKSGKRTAHGDRINATRSRTRARGEHAFRIVKQLWGFAKVRYRGLAKNTPRAFEAFRRAVLRRVGGPLRVPEYDRLRQQMFEVDPLTCRICRGIMRVVAFITQASVIDRILTHLRIRTSREAHERVGGPAALHPIYLCFGGPNTGTFPNPRLVHTATTPQPSIVRYSAGTVDDRPYTSRTATSSGKTISSSVAGYRPGLDRR
jgi:IS5 family transposase